jgi:hypothetical protein
MLAVNMTANRQNDLIPFIQKIFTVCLVSNPVKNKANFKT